MPKAITYKPNSVVYFRGDLNDKIFILKSGKIVLKSNDIETGQETADLVQTGEFFGVKSALGRYPREDDALVLSTADVIAFTVPEFEQMVSANTRIIIKMLKVFSNQLRRIHAKVRSLLGTEEQVDAEAGLFGIAEFYVKKKKYQEAIYVAQKYIGYYPNGRFADAAAQIKRKSEQFAERYGSHGAGKAKPADSQARAEQDALSDAGKGYFAAIELFGRQDFAGALKAFQANAKLGDAEYTSKSLYEMGRCLLGLKQYAAAIKHYTAVLQKDAHIAEANDCVFQMATAYGQSGDKPRAKALLQKLAGNQALDDDLKRKVSKALHDLEG